MTAELKFVFARDGIAGKLTAELTASGAHGAVSAAGVSPRRGFPLMEIAADGALYLKGTAARPQLNASDVVTGEYTLTVWQGRTELARVTFEPVALNNVIDVNNLIMQGRAQYATPEELLSLNALLTTGQQQQTQTAQALADLAQQQAAIGATGLLYLGETTNTYILGTVDRVVQVKPDGYYDLNVAGQVYRLPTYTLTLGGQ